MTMVRFREGMIDKKNNFTLNQKISDDQQEKFFKILEENHDPKYKWRKMVEWKK